MSIVLILGSAPNVTAVKDWPKSLFTKILAINNAWLVRPDWDAAIYAWDFPLKNRPTPEGDQRIIEEDCFVPVQNDYGGFVYSGGTMAFTAGYFALGHYKPKVLAFMGCDMVYTNMLKTHFYGVGTADPLREDITLRDLEAKSVRLQVMGARQGCAVVNLSHDPSRLTFPCAELDSLGQTKPDSFNENLVTKALELERNLGYYTPSGRYWEDESRFNADKIDELDKLWSHIKTRE